MTNFDPGGLLMLLTILLAVPLAVVSVGAAHLAERLGVADYGRSVAALLAVAAAGLLLAGVVVSDGILQLLVGLVLATVGAYAVTRSVRAASYGWGVGVVLLFLAFWAASLAGVYQGVNNRGEPLGVVARHLPAFYYGGLLIAGAAGGALVDRVGERLHGVGGGSPSGAD